TPEPDRGLPARSSSLVVRSSLWSPQRSSRRRGRMGGMTDYGHDLQFGLFPTPDAASLPLVVELTRLADATGLDVVSIQDHPYQRRHLDTWTLLSYLGAVTTSVRLAPNVVSLPLRPPAVLAKSAATLDLLT